ncbi:MAG: hypothetical protein FD180_4582 [Planctomycetota bacterium]|nr:MAG: hypothetical protein FD180_4582 [Planctomycetota bacterium]
MTRPEVRCSALPRCSFRHVRRLVAFVAAAILAFPLSSAAGMVQTPKPDPVQLEKALREALPGQAEQAALLVGPDGPRAGISSFLLELIIYGSIIALILLIGAIAIIGYGLTKKDKDEDRLSPIR